LRSISTVNPSLFTSKNCYKTNVSDTRKPSHEINTFELHRLAWYGFLYFSSLIKIKRSIVAVDLNKYHFQMGLMQKTNGPSFNSIKMVSTGKIRIYEPPKGFNLFKFQTGKPGLNPDLPHGFPCYTHMRTYYLGLSKLSNAFTQFLCITIEKPINNISYYEKS